MVHLHTSNLNTSQPNSLKLFEEEQVQKPPPLEESHDEQLILPQPTSEELLELVGVRKSSRVRK